MMDENELSDLRLSKKHMGLIINFHVRVLKDGTYRLVNIREEKFFKTLRIFALSAFKSNLLEP